MCIATGNKLNVSAVDTLGTRDYRNERARQICRPTNRSPHTIKHRLVAELTVSMVDTEISEVWSDILTSVFPHLSSSFGADVERVRTGRQRLCTPSPRTMH